MLFRLLTKMFMCKCCQSNVFDGIATNCSQVSVSFSNDTVRPADTVSFTVAAHPASYVGLLAVDQSVLLLRQGNDITRDSVR